MFTELVSSMFTELGANWGPFLVWTLQSLVAGLERLEDFAQSSGLGVSECR
jgi:hypothetical protein